MARKIVSLFIYKNKKIIIILFRKILIFNEIKNIDYAHRHMADSVSLCFSSALKRLVCDDITPGELLTEVEESYRFEEKRRKAMSFFMINSAAVDF